MSQELYDTYVTRKDTYFVKLFIYQNGTVHLTFNCNSSILLMMQFLLLLNNLVFEKLKGSHIFIY